MIHCLRGVSVLRRFQSPCQSNAQALRGMAIIASRKLKVVGPFVELISLFDASERELIRPPNYQALIGPNDLPFDVTFLQSQNKDYPFDTRPPLRYTGHTPLVQSQIIQTAYPAMKVIIPGEPKEGLKKKKSQSSDRI
ncbi:uncharacterized protein LOC107272674 [Cephus cinctus]|uniref:Uncharacterized protein LOC107272674 n=1 Tax=Cephus cinctus TaxID=211228 RepID=A0AAJ7RS84_CEPCN|nr:uncharacterized protein LOC107272674 [Cephus cinctus]